MNSELDDNAAWAGFLNGNKKDFETIYNRYYGLLINYASKFGLDICFIEEAIQDLFVKLWNNKSTLGHPAAVKYYLLRALKNIINNKLSLSRKEIYMGDATDLLAFDIPVELGDGEKEYHQAQINKLMETLTDRQKEAIYLLYVEGLTYKEIAELLKINIGGTYKLVYRAINGIRKQAKDLDISGKMTPSSGDEMVIPT